MSEHIYGDTEETRFMSAFYTVLERNPDEAPGPTAINLVLGKSGGRTPMNVLNGRMSVLRRRLLRENGFVQDPPRQSIYGETNFGRWRRPYGGSQ